jgi:hypothetical protein
MDLTDLAFRAGIAAAVLAVAGSLALWHPAPLLLGILGLPVGGVAGRLLFDPPPFTDFGSDMQGYIWVLSFAFIGAFVGAVAGMAWAIWGRARRAST